jgi:AraC family transcriptional regulator, regulatory protein of adaptative response / DNA-3-methyladenine glycosylase II
VRRDADRARDLRRPRRPAAAALTAAASASENGEIEPRRKARLRVMLDSIAKRDPVDAPPSADDVQAESSPTILDRQACYRAMRARDARFDGRIFVAVRTTGIYCRPICPARPPRLENIVFFPSAAAAQEAGFRPCLRCRPECSPDLAAWRGTSNTVSRALALIAEGELDETGRGVEDLAARLGVGERQLRRLFKIHLGASPIAVAQTRRVLFAKQLIHETRMRMIDVALAAGFGSVRRFNDTFRRLYARPPSALRRAQARAEPEPNEGSGIALTLGFSPPYDWDAAVDFFAARAIPGVESVSRKRYARTLEIDGSKGTLAVEPIAGRHALRATIRFARVAALPAIIGRLRRQFDLRADVEAIAAHLSLDPLLAPMVRRRPGLRVPGAWDPFELAVRAIVGQQITVGAARTLLARLVAAFGEPLDAADAAPGLTRAFPRPERLADADLCALGMPRARARALSALSAAVAHEPDLLRAEPDLEGALRRLRALPGIGEWTVQYVALRALRDPDAFPAADLGLLRAVAGSSGVRPSAATLLARAERWRPWRAYAAQHLWTASAERPRASVPLDRRRPGGASAPRRRAS